MDFPSVEGRRYEKLCYYDKLSCILGKLVVIHLVKGVSKNNFVAYLLLRIIGISSTSNCVPGQTGERYRFCRSGSIIEFTVCCSSN